MKKYILTGFLFLFVCLGQAFASPLSTKPYLWENKYHNFYLPCYANAIYGASSNWKYPRLDLRTSASDWYSGPYYFDMNGYGCNNNYDTKNPVSQVSMSYDSSIWTTTWTLVDWLASSDSDVKKSFTVSASGVEFDWLVYDGRFATTNQVCLYSTDWGFHTICANWNKSSTWGIKDLVFFHYRLSNWTYRVFMVNFNELMAWSSDVSLQYFMDSLMWKYTYQEIYEDISRDTSYSLSRSESAWYLFPVWNYVDRSVWALPYSYTYSQDEIFIEPDSIFNPWGNNWGWLVLNTNDYRQCSSRMDAIIKYANYYGRCYVLDEQQANWNASNFKDYADIIINSHSQILPADIADMRTNIPFCATFAEYNNQLISPESVLNDNLLFDWERAEDVWFVDYYNYKNPFKSIAYSLFWRVWTLSYDETDTIEFKYNFSSDSVCWGLPSSASDANSEVSSRYNWVKNMFEDDWTGSWTVGDSLFDSTIPVFWIVADKLKSPVVDSYNSGFSQIVPPSCVSTVSIPAMDYLVYGLAIIIILSLFLFL